MLFNQYKLELSIRMAKSIGIKLIITIFILHTSHSENVDEALNCVTKIDHGTGIGILKQTVHNAKNYCSFLAVPYAQPPTGDLRFEVKIYFDFTIKTINKLLLFGTAPSKLHFKRDK